MYVDGKHKGNITDDFGNLKLTFFVGTEYAGTITVPKLSTFAVALQDSDGTNMKNTAGNHIINRFFRVPYIKMYLKMHISFSKRPCLQGLFVL